MHKNKESGTDYEPVVEEALKYIVRRLRNGGGKKVARRVRENEESSMDFEPKVEEDSNNCSEATKPGRDESGEEVARE